MKEYKQKVKELKEVDDRINFAYENWGMVDTTAEKKRERISQEIKKIVEDEKKYCI